MKTFVEAYRKSPATYLILALIILFAIFVRVWNVNNNLGFYFDQGRDALVIWDFWKNGDWFLIGPTTGIAGIFRGPWYYWLITPFYILGGGNPVYPAVLLSLTTVLAIFFLFLVAKELVNAWAGLIAVVIASFSYYIVVHSRWLSNPTPMLLISTMLLWAMIQATKKKSWSFPLIGFLVGMAIQFGSAAEIFYIPTVLIFTIVNRKILPKKRTLVLSFALFFISFIPQILFDILKGGVLSSAVVDFLVAKESFRLSFWEVASIRLNQYRELFSSIIIPGDLEHVKLFVWVGVLVVVANFKHFWKKQLFKILVIFIALPLIGMLFFQGNYGNVFDYYYSGYYFPVILLFSLPLGYLATSWFGKFAIFLFLIIFFQANTHVLREFIVRGRTHFTFAHQKMAIEWIYKDAVDENFNVDVYVPPVIPYAYDYLFKWYPSTSLGTVGPPTELKVPLLYTLYELDPPSPERLEAWLKRQEGIGKVEKEYSFGGITVQRRNRI